MTDQYYLTNQSVNEYIKMAEGYDGRELIEELKEFLPENSSVLELGSGPGVDLKILSEKYTVTGSDFSQHFLDYISAKHPDFELLLLNAVALDTQRKFDCIFSNKVLQHLTNDELQKSIKKQSSILNNGGLICHSFWNGEDCYEMDGALHNYHTKIEIEKWFKPNFDICHLSYYEELEPEDSLFLIAKLK